jgi:TM2 domain-containing membrane protein YozV
MTSPLPGPAAPLPPPAAYTPSPAGPTLPKNPWVALVLSLFPGVGQIYNGQIAKGLCFFFGEAFCIYGAADINWFPFAFLIPFVYFYNLVDAWRSATLINARFLGGQPVVEEDTSESPAWGVALIVLGLVILFHNFGWLEYLRLERWWPLVIVAAGGAFLYGSVRRRNGAAPGRSSSPADDAHVR